MKIKTIVVPLDGSALAEAALRPAVDLARDYRAQLVLVRAAGDVGRRENQESDHQGRAAHIADPRWLSTRSVQPTRAGAFEERLSHASTLRPAARDANQPEGVDQAYVHRRTEGAVAVRPSRAHTGSTGSSPGSGTGRFAGDRRPTQN